MWITSKKCWGFCLLLITLCLCYAGRDVRSHCLLLHSSIHWQFEWFIVVHQNHTFIQSWHCSDLNNGYYFPFFPLKHIHSPSPHRELLYNSSCVHVHVPCCVFSHETIKYSWHFHFSFQSNIWLSLFFKLMSESDCSIQTNSKCYKNKCAIVALTCFYSTCSFITIAQYICSKTLGQCL